MIDDRTTQQREGDRTTAHPEPPEEAGKPPPRVAKRGFTRSGSALCGVLGFQQHLGLGPSMLAGIGWLIASDHAGFLLRRRYGTRIRSRLSRRQPKGPAQKRLISWLHALLGDPRRIDAVPYHVYALINIASATVWGSAFVAIGYLLTALGAAGV